MQLYRISITTVLIIHMTVCGFENPLLIRFNHENALLSKPVADMIQNTILVDINQPIYNAYKSTSNTFSYYDSAIGERYPFFNATYEFATVESVNAICSSESNKSHYLYYSGNLQQPQFKAWHATLHAGNIIVYKNVVSRVSTNVWIGDKNVIATAHYDTVSNVYIQLKGKLCASLFI